MAGDWQGLALEKAELLSARLKEVLISGQEYARAQFGVDLGLKPELYPAWLVLSTAALGLLLLLLLGVSWAAVCGGLLVGKKRGSPVSQGSGEPDKANTAKTAKPEEQKRKNKKKTTEKKTQSNGQPVVVAQEEVKAAEVVSKHAPQIKTEKVQVQVQAPVQVKKNKKKTKTDVKPVQQVSTNDAKEPDDGAWETKVSNREKKQQRRKDKGPGDSGSPGGVEAPKTNVQAPVATNTKKNRGNHESQHPRAAGKGEAASGAVSSSWRETPSVNGGSWSDMSLKMHVQAQRAPPKRQPWAQEPQAWSGIDGRIKTELNPVSYTMPVRNTPEPISNSVQLQLAPPADDPWSGSRSADPNTDWSAPEEHWGNCEENPVLATPAPPLKEQPAPNKVSEDEKDTEDPSGGAAKSKKKRKKKKKTEEEAASEAQTVSAAPLSNAVPKPQELPVLASKKQNPSISSSQKKSEQVVEPPKPSQKKKVRRET